MAEHSGGEKVQASLFKMRRVKSKVGTIGNNIAEPSELLANPGVSQHVQISCLYTRSTVGRKKE